MMSPRAAGAALALAAAVLLAIATVVPPWWTGYPVVDDKPTHMKTVHAGPLGATTCNTGGDGACSNTSITMGFTVIGHGAAVIDIVLALMLAALGVTTLLGSETRKVVGRAAKIGVGVAGGLGLLVLILGPGIKMPEGHALSVPMSYGVALFLAGIAAAVGAVVVTKRDLAGVAPRPTVVAAPGPAPAFDVGALFAADPVPAKPPAGPPTMAGLSLPQPAPVSPPPPMAPRSPTLPPPMVPRSPTLPPPIVPRSPPLPAIPAPRSPTLPPPVRAKSASLAPGAAIPPPPFGVLAPVAPPPSRARTTAPPPEPVVRKSIPPRQSFVLPMDTQPVDRLMPPPVRDRDEEFEGETNDAALPITGDATRADVAAAPEAPDLPEDSISETIDRPVDAGDRTSPNIAPAPDGDATVATPPIDPDAEPGTNPGTELGTTADAEPADPFRARDLDSSAVSTSAPRPGSTRPPVASASGSASRSSSAPTSASASSSAPASSSRSISGATPATKSAPKIPLSTASTELPPPTADQAAAASGPTPACPQCEAPMAWVEEHLRFYCKSCRMYF